MLNKIFIIYTYKINHRSLHVEYMKEKYKTQSKNAAVYAANFSKFSKLGRESKSTGYIG